MSFYIKNGSRLPDAHSTRPERGKLLFNSLRLRQGAPESHPPGDGYLQTISFDRLRPEWNPIVGVVRRFVPFQENNERSDNAPRPRLENRLALSNKLFHLDLAPLSTYSFRQVVPYLVLRQRCRSLYALSRGTILQSVSTVWENRRLSTDFPRERGEGCSNDITKHFQERIYTHSGTFYVREAVLDNFEYLYAVNRKYISS